MKHFTKLSLTLFASAVSMLVSAQNEFSFVLNSEVKVLNMQGDTMDFGFSGGINQAGVHNLDVNNDGLDDVVTFDRFSDNYGVYLRNSDGTYTYSPEYEEFLPQDASGWVVFADYNGDGKRDCWFFNRALAGSISLYKNVTGVGDDHVKFRVYDDILRTWIFHQFIDSTDVYCNRFNVPAINDIDGDGDLDFLTLQPNGVGVTLFLNVSKELGLPLDSVRFDEADLCWGDFEEDIDSNIYLRRPKGCNDWKVYRHLKKHVGGSSMLLIDVDNDSDMDLILGNAGYDNLTFLENGKNDFNRKIDTMIDFEINYPPTKPVDLESFPGAYYVDVDADDVRDLVVTATLSDVTSGTVSERNNVWFYKNTGTNELPKWYFKREDLWVGDMVDFGSRAAPAFLDLDKDGDLDFILGTNGDFRFTNYQNDRLAYFENVGSATKPEFQLKNDNFLDLDQAGLRRINPFVSDIDGDGVLDLFLGKSNGLISHYHIIGNDENATGVLITQQFGGIDVENGAAPCLADVNGDGTLDLLCGTEEGWVEYYENKGTSASPNFDLITPYYGKANPADSTHFKDYFDFINNRYVGDTIIYQGNGFSIPRFLDIDNNGNKDLVVSGNKGRTLVYRQVANPKDTFKSDNHFIYNTLTNTCTNYNNGSRGAIGLADLDGDDLVDMMLGNGRGGLHYLTGQNIDCNPFSTLGIEAVVLPLKVYPNPTHGIVYIQYPKHLNKRAFTVSVYNLQGQVVLTQVGSDVIDMSSLPMGCYIMKSTDGRQILNARIVKTN
jgi:hypothetical protein